MRQALVYRKGVLAGILTESEGEYTFVYNGEYLQREDSKAISLTMPLSDEPYISPTLHPFFDGLIPEGWLLDVALRNTDISILDRIEELLSLCTSIEWLRTSVRWVQTDTRLRLAECGYCQSQGQRGTGAHAQWKEIKSQKE